MPGEGDRAVAHAELRWPAGGGIMLGSTSPTSGLDAGARPAAATTYCVCDDPDALLRPGQRPPAPRWCMDIEDTDYGSRGFTVRDPEGNLWSFGTYPGSPRPRP